MDLQTLSEVSGGFIPRRGNGKGRRKFPPVATPHFYKTTAVREQEAEDAERRWNGGLSLATARQMIADADLLDGAVGELSSWIGSMNPGQVAQVLASGELEARINTLKLRAQTPA